MAYIKKPGITAGAIGVTASLLYMMQGLAGADDTLILDESPTRYIDIPIEDITVDPPERITRALKKPEPTVIPDPPVTPVTPDGEGPVAIITPPPQPPEPSSGTTFFSTNETSDLVPLVRIQPTYPQRAMERGVEGWVVLRFDVDMYGTVTNAVIEEEQPAGYFSRSALKAISKFRFKPRMVNGQAYDSVGERYKLSYTLSE